MLAQDRAQPLGAVAAQHRPQLERAKAATERRPVVGERERLVVSAQILGRQRERLAPLVRPRSPDERAVGRDEQPLVRVDHEAVGELDAVCRPALLLADPGGARVGGVDVEPGTGCVRPPGELAHRVDRSERRRAHSRDDTRRVVEVVAVDAHPQLVVHRNLAQLHPEHPRVLFHGRMRVLGAHDDVAPRHVPRGDQRCEGRGGGRVLDVAVPAFGEAEQLSHPVCDAQLELRRGRGSAPDERDLVQRRGEQLREDRRLRRGDCEVGEEARALPVRHGRQEKLVEVAQDIGELLRLLGSRRRQLRRELAGLDLRKHRQVADPLEVARRPLERGGAVLPETAHGRFFRTLSSCFQVRVLATSAFVSQPRRACATASST